MTCVFLRRFLAICGAGLLLPACWPGMARAEDSAPPPDDALYELSQESYTYNYWGKSVSCPDPYRITAVLDGSLLGCGSFDSISDIFVDKNGSLYIADTGHDRIVRLNPDFTFDREYGGVIENGVLAPFQKPQGIFVTPENDILVADTENQRLIRMDSEGRLLRHYATPEGNGFPENFVYKPQKLSMDEAGRIYVVAAFVNQGIIMLSPDGGFDGFLAAAKVSPDPWEIIWKKLSTDEQRNRMSDFVPIEYNNLCMDSEGFLFATTAAIDAQLIVAQVQSRVGTEESAVVRRLNMNGQDILRRKGFYPPVGDIEDLQDSAPAYSGVSQIMDVACGENGTYSMVDNKRKRVFTYDYDGNLLYAFSGQGLNAGGFQTPVALEMWGEYLAVADKNSGLVTVFSMTEYAQLINAAIKAYSGGEYSIAEQRWKQVMAQNSNFDMAYSGMGKAAYRNGQYADAMRYFELGNNREWYSKAYNEYRAGIIAVWLGPVVILILGISAVGWGWGRVRKKRKAGEKFER